MLPFIIFGIWSATVTIIFKALDESPNKGSRPQYQHAYYTPPPTNTVPATTMAGEKREAANNVTPGLVSSPPRSEAKSDVVTGVGREVSNSSVPATAEASAAQTLSILEPSKCTDFYVDWASGEIQCLQNESGLHNPTRQTSTLPKQVSFINLLALSDLHTGKKDPSMARIANFEKVMLIELSTDALVCTETAKGDACTAVTSCKERSYPIEDVIVDILQIAEKTKTAENAANYLTLERLIRYLEIQSYNCMVQVADKAARDPQHAALQFEHLLSKLESNLLDPSDSADDLETLVTKKINDAENAVNEVPVYH